MDPNILNNMVAHLTNEMRSLGDGFRNAGIASISLANIKFFDGNKDSYLTWRKDLEKYFVVAGIGEDRQVQVAYQLTSGKAENLIKHFIESVPGATWVELRTLLDRSYVEVTDPMDAIRSLANVRQRTDESIDEYKYKVISLYDKAFPGEAMGQEREKRLVDAFRSGIANAEIQRLIIRQNPATLEEAARLALVEFSILAQTKKVDFAEPMEIDHHRRRIDVEAVSRDLGRTRYPIHRQQQPTGRWIPNRPHITCWRCGRKGHIQMHCQYQGNEERSFGERRSPNEPTYRR